MKDKNDNFIGVFVTENEDYCFRLQALLQDKSKSALIRSVLIDYLQEKDLTIELLTERYAHYIYMEWELRSKDNVKFDDMMAMENEKLIRKNIPVDIIDQIMDICKEKERLHSLNK